MLLVNQGMFGSVAPVGDIYLRREGWMLSLLPCRSPSSSDLLSLSYVDKWLAAKATLLFDISLLIWISGRFIWQCAVIIWVPCLIMWTPAEPVWRGGGRRDDGNGNTQTGKSRGGNKTHTHTLTQTNHPHLFTCIVFLKYISNAWRPEWDTCELC